MNRRLLVSAALLLLCCCADAAAQVQVSFPLQGHYRPGKYLPVRITADASVTGPVVLRAAGAVRLSVETRPGGTDVVVPWLAASDVRDVTWSTPGGASGAVTGPVDAPLAPLEPRQVLVGAAGTSIAAAVEAATPLLFPGQGIVPVPLPGTPPLRGDARAWEALDVIAFDDSPGEAALADLLGAGISVVVRTERPPPAGDWPWRGGPGRWFISFTHYGPAGVIVPEAYEPVSGWNPGWPAPLRRRVALLAVVFCILALGASLWRPTRRGVLATFAVAVAAACGFAVWAARQPHVREAVSGVTVRDERTTQRDRWTYARPLRSGDVWLEWDRYGKPVFASPRHFRGADLELRCAAGGRPLGYSWRAGAHTTLAFLSRGPGPPSPPYDPAQWAASTSPLRDFARQGYAGSGDAVLGDPTVEMPPPDADRVEHWPDVVVVRRPSPRRAPAAGTAPSAPPR